MVFLEIPNVPLGTVFAETVRTYVLYIDIPVFYMSDMGVLHTYITLIYIVFYIAV